jgi:hypothetical protein
MSIAAIVGFIVACLFVLPVVVVTRIMIPEIRLYLRMKASASGARPVRVRCASGARPGSSGVREQSLLLTVWKWRFLPLNE